MSVTTTRRIPLLDLRDQYAQIRDEIAVEKVAAGELIEYHQGKLTRSLSWTPPAAGIGRAVFERWLKRPSGSC
jgi:hypothetical protein